MDSINYEGKGIPVDLEILNTLQDLSKKQDPVVIQALRELKNNYSSEDQ